MIKYQVIKDMWYGEKSELNLFGKIALVPFFLWMYGVVTIINVIIFTCCKRKP